MKHLENKITLFSIVWKKFGQITHLPICDGIDDAQMYISSIYHRHIEHFFHIFGGSTVFSLISESARRL